MLGEYATYCRAAGQRPSSIRLRLQWLNRAERELPAGLGAASVADLLNWLGSHDWKPETRRSARSALRSFYSWAIEAGQLECDPSSRLPAVRVPAGIPRPAPTDVLQTALATATDRDQLILAMAAFAGLRRCEIAPARWTDISWLGLRIVGKGGRSRSVPLLPRLAGMLDAERGRRLTGETGTGYRYGVDPYSPFIFPSHRGGHLSPYTVGHILGQALGPGWTGHTLRHRFATLAYAVDRDLLTVQQLMGHSSPQTTARYTALPPGAAIAAVAGVAA